MVEPDLAAFHRLVETYTRPAAPPLVPEIRLYLASEITPIWRATEEELANLGLPPPFWAFCWPGGQALARYVLDRPESVRGKRVLDFACGGGVAAIAAARAGGTSWGCDIDPFAVAALGMNRDLNDVSVTGIRADPTQGPADVLPEALTVILAGDIFYERTMAERSITWLKARAAAGATVLIGDPGRAYLPRDVLTPEIGFDVPTSRELEDSDVRHTTVWRL